MKYASFVSFLLLDPKWIPVIQKLCNCKLIEIQSIEELPLNRDDSYETKL